MSRLPSVMLDARKLGDGGIGVYIENLVDGILELTADTGTPPIDLSLLVPSESVVRSCGSKGGYISSVLERWGGEFPIVRESAPQYSLREYMLLSLRQRKELQKIDLFHAPHYTLPLFLGIPAVTTVHDVIHVAFPDTPVHSVAGRALIGSALRRSAHVITVSRASKREIIRQFGKSAAPISVIPNAVRKDIAPLSKHELDCFLAEHGLLRPYCLFVGNDRPHKRFSLLLEVWASLSRVWSSEGELPLLVAVGSKFSKAIRDQVSQLGLNQHVRFCSDIDTTELSALYNGAQAVLIPSREEGFGLVALEAFTCGTQVITTPMPSIREVCGPLAHYAADFSSGSFYAVVADLLHRPDFASAARPEREERASCFGREKVSQLTCAAYYRTLGLDRPEQLTRGIEVERVIDASSLCTDWKEPESRIPSEERSSRIH